jgi:hypothetical protein
MAKHQQHNKRESIIMTDQLKATEKKQAATEIYPIQKSQVIMIHKAELSITKSYSFIEDNLLMHHHLSEG